MKRKEFLSKSLTAGVLPVFINGFSVKAMTSSPLLEFLGKAGNEDRVLVMIQLNGGNDGLNTVIPLDQYSNLFNARSNIIIAENKVLNLTGTQATGLHPALNEIKNLYNDGMISIVQDVGYPNPDFSHFRSTDIWLTASDSKQYLNSGWMGRYLDTKYPDFPNNYPNANYPDPPAIQIGAMVSPAFQGPSVSMGMSITDPNSFYQFVSGTVDQAPDTPSGHELTFVRLVAQQTQAYSGSIKNAATKNNPANLSTLYPAQGTNTLADQLKIVAQLIAGGLKTRVYMVTLGGFDTHATQVVNGATETGSHATLLQRLSQAVNAFQDDIKKLGVADKVLGMTFSEFGRRIKSNAALGTDHGAAAPLFLFGTKVKGGIYGNNPTISSTVGVNDNVPMQFDFRSIYTTILKEWFEVNDTDLNNIMLKQFTPLNLIQGASTGLTSEAAKIGVMEIFPNPANDFANLNFTCSGGHVSVKLFNGNGQEIGIMAQGYYAKGNHQINLSTSGLKNGTYYLQISNGSNAKSMPLLVAH